MRPFSRQRAEFRFTGWHMLICLLLFFGTIIAVNIGMAVLASSSWTGLVVKNSYVASQKFNAELDAAKLQKSHGWTSRLAYENGVLTFRLLDRDGISATMTGSKLAVGRPAFEQQDMQLALPALGDGVHAARIELAPGNWFLRVDGLIDGKPYRRDARLLVDQNLSGTLQ